MIRVFFTPFVKGRDYMKYIGTVYSCVGRPGEVEKYCYDFVPELKHKIYKSSKEIVNTWKNLSDRIINYYATEKNVVTVSFETRKLEARSGPYLCVTCNFFGDNVYIGYTTMHIHE